MIEMIALVLFLAVIVAMIAGPENKARVSRTETAETTPVKPSIAQTA